MPLIGGRSILRLIAGTVGAVALLACGGGGGGTETPSATGGVGTGGRSSTGGASAATGGTKAATGGGSQAQGGAAGATSATGGTSTGGGPSSGGSGTGGTGSGGSTSTGGGRSGGGGATGGSGRGGGGPAGGATSAGGQGGQGPTNPTTCPATALKSGNTTHTISAGGRNREYILHVPSSYTGKTAVPLIVDFHGHGGTGSSQQNDSPYPKVVDSESVLMAFPTAVGDWNIGPCCADGIDDIGFAKAVVADVEKLGCVDPKRVYAAGFSMGGGMSHQLACQAADVFAAVAPAAFDLLQENLATCKPQRPITVITFRGSNDNLALYNGGLSNLVRPINFLGAIASMKKWGELDGCTGSPSDLGNNCQGFMASQCPGGVEAIVCTKQGGGHEQGNATLGWPVLKRHQLP